jgi:HK97 gp10 family phage protein
MATATIKLHGARELKAALEALPKRVGKAVLRRALQKAAAPLEADVKQRASAISKRLGTDRISISTKLSRRQRRGRKKVGQNGAELFVGAHSSRRGHAHLIEFGTGPRYQKSGKYTGVMPAMPYFRPAWEANKGQMLSILQKALWQEIEKAAKRLAKRQAKAVAP